MFLDDILSLKSISIPLICCLRCESGRVHLYAAWELEELHFEASADKVQRSISIWALPFIQIKWYQDNGAVTDIIDQSWSVKSCDLFELCTCISQIKTWRRTSLTKGRGKKPKEHTFPSSSRNEENANVQGQMKQGACECEEGEDWLSSKDQWDASLSIVYTGNYHLRQLPYNNEIKLFIETTTLMVPHTSRYVHRTKLILPEHQWWDC